MAKKRTITLKDALDRYIDTVSVDKKGWQQESYRRNVIKKYPIATMYMHEITSVDVAEYRDYRLSEINPKTGKPISGNTVRLELALLSSLYNLAISEWGTCTVNPVKPVRRPKCNPGRNRRLSAFEERILTKFFKKNSNELYCIFVIALETGMRQGEILSLLWENINLQTGIAHLPETKNGTWRDVPLTIKARKMLADMEQKIRGKVFGYKSSGFKSAWRRAILELEIEDLHFHDLRHEAISRLFELGTLNVIEIASISGHKSLMMLKRYTHLRAYQLVKKLDAKKKSINKLATYFVPYPAIVSEDERGMHIVDLLDFSEIQVQAVTKEKAVEEASSCLLKVLARAAQNGKSVPVPGELRGGAKEIILINPLQ
ncbi:site-specific integrase [Citrobacter freundii]|uniref:site-specific integrase n=1 Tax=Citrobacter freundii TaxID=546 RepID=UPI001905E8AE|nr:site-specific integrase [Citrobacter freundii]MBJ8931633.1 site-specific integrase [Citrobacter freundii]